MKVQITVARAQLIKAIVRRMFEIDMEHAIGADMDAGFDGGEWSGPAHDTMREARHENMLCRLSAPERRLAEAAYQLRQEYEGDCISSAELQQWYTRRGLTVSH